MIDDWNVTGEISARPWALAHGSLSVPFTTTYGPVNLIFFVVVDRMAAFYCLLILEKATSHGGGQCERKRVAAKTAKGIF